MNSSKEKARAKRRPKAEADLPAGPAPDRLAVLAEQVATLRPEMPHAARTLKLIAAGIPKMAQKVVEEAAEVAIDAVRGDRAAVICESANLLYNLTVLLTRLDIAPAEVWAEMDRRQTLLGIAEKLPKQPGAEV